MLSEALNPPSGSPKGCMRPDRYQQVRGRMERTRRTMLVRSNPLSIGTNRAALLAALVLQITADDVILSHNLDDVFRGRTDSVGDINGRIYHGRVHSDGRIHSVIYPTAPQLLSSIREAILGRILERGIRIACVKGLTCRLKFKMFASANAPHQSS